MANNKWQKPKSPPPQLFFNNKERDLVKQVNDELIERVIGQEILYFPIDLNSSNFHPLYGESIEKTFLSPIRVYALIEWEGNTTNASNGVIDRRSSITIHFHSRRLQEDQDIYVQEGDFVRYGEDFYEIVELNRPRLVFGDIGKKLEVSAKCVSAREDLFNAT
jgi:hypothetical protein